jgi:hypothetical protein
MRFLFLPLLILSAQAFAQTCNESMLLTASYPLNCDSLSVAGNIDLSSRTSPIVINVQNDVVIKAQIKLSGGNGGLLPYSPVDTFGGAAGPGAGAGGGIEFYEAANAEDFPNGGSRGGFDTSTSCGDGAGGGGFYNPGGQGTPCTDPTLIGAEGGIPFDLTNIETTLRGGFGGGAGHGPDYPIAAGGGGGGAIYIISQGKITIMKTGSIIANGGNGANSSNVNGAGGGGSGGGLTSSGAGGDGGKGAVIVYSW